MKNKVLEAWFYIVVAMIFTGYSFYLFSRQQTYQDMV